MMFNFAASSNSDPRPQFYEIPDYAGRELPPITADTGMDSMTLYLAGQVHTVHNYQYGPTMSIPQFWIAATWPDNSPVEVEPDAEVGDGERSRKRTTRPTPIGPDTAPFKMADIASTQQATWATGVASSSGSPSARRAATSSGARTTSCTGRCSRALGLPRCATAARGATGSAGEATATPGS
ncbi:MAG: hypothetical protein U0528_06935 [Anaerolineae bacterium]